jgi:hypothetical protein
MFADTTGFTTMCSLFITGKQKTPHYLMKRVGTRMSKMSMPKIDASGESARTGAEGGGRLDWI